MPLVSATTLCSALCSLYDLLVPRTRQELGKQTWYINHSTTRYSNCIYFLKSSTVELYSCLSNYFDRCPCSMT